MRLVLLFMFIFSFPVTHISPSILNSTNIVGGLLIILSLYSIDYRQILLRYINKNRVVKIALGLIVVLLFSLLVILIHGTGDFTLIPTLINLFLKLTIGYMLFSFYVYTSKFKGSIFNVVLTDLVLIFIIQSILQFVFIFFPGLSEMFNIFRSPYVIALNSNIYGGARGIALAGSGFFGLAVGYGFIIFLYLVYRKLIMDRLKINYILYAAFLLVLVLGGFIAGRSSIAGLVLGIAYIIIERFILIKKWPTLKNRYNISNNKNTKYTLFIIFSVLILIIIFGFYLILNYRVASELPPFLQGIYSFYRYLLDPFYRLIYYGEFRVSSLDTLFDMYFPVPLNTFVFGDGRYTGVNGGYYMATDSGYMRNILFFGIFGFVLLFIYQLFFIDWKKRDYFIQNIFVMLYILVMHYKGEVLGFAQMLLMMMILLVLGNDYDTEYEIDEHISKHTLVK